MDFRFKNHFGILFMCICFLLSCCSEQKTSLKDIQVVWATDYSEDGLDFLLKKDTTYIYPNNKFVFKKSMSFYTLSDKEFSLATAILKDFFDYYLYDDDNTGVEPFRLRKYFRQYIGFKEKDSLYVYVNLYTHFPTISNSECLCTIGPAQNVLIYKENGGRNYGTAIIDISNKRIIYFKMGNKDPNYKVGGYSEQELEVLFP
jgi:hypothetical protein